MKTVTFIKTTGINSQMRSLILYLIYLAAADISQTFRCVCAIEVSNIQEDYTHAYEQSTAIIIPMASLKGL